MNRLSVRVAALAAALVSFTTAYRSTAADAPPKVPRFSVSYMDRSVSPAVDFYHYADGTWLKENPVPGDKSRWGAFNEVDQRNWTLLHQILEDAETANAPAKTVTREVGDFYKSAMDTNHLEELGLSPLEEDFKDIDAIKSTGDLFALLAKYHTEGVEGLFGDNVEADDKKSDVYAFFVGQGGLSLPDRDYYLKDGFAKQRQAYLIHLIKVFGLLGDDAGDAAAHALTVFNLEKSMAEFSKARVDLRDPLANYHKVPTDSLATSYPDLPFGVYLAGSGLTNMPDLIVGQPEYLAGLDQLVKTRPLDDWKTYLRWKVTHTAAQFMTSAMDKEFFSFFGTELSGTPGQEPRWQRAGRMINANIGEALGQLYVEKYFPPAARQRMNDLVENLKAVYRDRLANVPWMSPPTRDKALAKFAKFTQKIGHPDKFRDYSTIEIRADDYLGNVRRANQFESRRQLARVGKPVDKTEWGMTPPTVNAYFNPLQNEIVFPAGILQPPFFDVDMDDAVNYGGIGVVIGHEITHGYDDQGRKYDADGNLNEWWTDDDAKAFQARAQKVVDQFSAYEALPGLHVNGQLTLGENIADLGGASVAFEALERALTKDPSKRKKIDGFTPEQRFFLSFAQVWRSNCRDAAMVQLITTDVHSPWQFRAYGASVNMQEFFDAFNIKPGDPMWRPPEVRAKIW
jgi:putative endopeptidase